MLDFSEIATSLQATVSTALTAIVPVAVGILSVFLGWKLLRKFLGR